jgi:hypothetical protein
MEVLEKQETPVAVFFGSLFRQPAGSLGRVKQWQLTLPIFFEGDFYVHGT